MAIRAIRQGAQDYLVKGASDGGALRERSATRSTARREEELHRLNRALKAHSHSDQAMMRATDESAYMDEVCKIVVKDCGHAMVWIGFAEDDKAKTVRPVAHAGFEKGYLETLQISWADTERGRGPTGTAIRTGQPSLCRNMLTDPQFAPWREEARKRRYASSIALPLMADGKAFGAMSIYSRDPDPFSEDEVKLLTDLCTDLAYGITALRIRAAHAKAQEALCESETRLRLALDAADAGTWEWDLRTNTNLWSEELWRLYGLEPHGCEPSYETWLQTVHPDDRSKTEHIVQEAARKGIELNAEWRVRDRDGTERWLMSRGRPVRDVVGQVVSMIGIVVDITKRKRAEEVLADVVAEKAARDTVAVMEEGVVLLDMSGTIMSVNPATGADIRLPGDPMWSAATSRNFSRRCSQPTNCGKHRKSSAI